MRKFSNVIRCFNKFRYNKNANDFKFGSSKANPNSKFSNHHGTKIVGGAALSGTIAAVLWFKHASCEEEEAQITRLPPNSMKRTTLVEAIEKARDLAQRVKDETGSPGLVVGVSVDGQPVWSEGLGYADVENRLQCMPDTVMRIASISKSITMAAVAKQLEKGKLDLDKPIQDYVPTFPKKTFEKEPVTITTRHLVTHTAGIRHYEKPKKKEKSEKQDKKASESEKADMSNDKKDLKAKDDKEEKKKKKHKKNKSDDKFKEFFIKDKFDSVSDSLKLFQDDPLLSKPGTKYAYTTHGWTLVSAVLEGATGQKFPFLIKGLFKDFGLTNTYLDEPDSLIYNRSRYYIKKRGRIINAPYVDLSYKWAGGGFLSTVGDLIKFGNAMLYSFQYNSPSDKDIKNHNSHDLTKPEAKHEPASEKISNNKTETYDETPAKDYSPSGDISDILAQNNQQSPPSIGMGNIIKPRLLPGYLRSETVTNMWSQDVDTKCDWDVDGFYGMGWAVVPDKQEYGNCRHQRYYTSHTGGAIGASSVLLILPRESATIDEYQVPPVGVVVAMAVNMSSVGLNKTALEIAKLFEQVEIK